MPWIVVAVVERHAGEVEDVGGIGGRHDWDVHGPVASKHEVVAAVLLACALACFEELGKAEKRTLTDDRLEECVASHLLLAWLLLLPLQLKTYEQCFRGVEHEDWIHVGRFRAYLVNRTLFWKKASCCCCHLVICSFF